jgi:hypothetical protein
MSEGTWRDVNYNVHLLIYGRNWQLDSDTMGPMVDPMIALPNPLDVSTRGTTLTLLAGVSDVLTGMSNISAAQWKEVPLSVTDPRLIDWTGASSMVIGSDSPTETGIAVHFPATWDGGETHRLCARGQDEFGNWGIGSCTDVITVGKLPFWIQVHLPYDVPGWLPISVPFPGGDEPIDSVLDTIRDKYDQVRSYDPITGDWLSYNPSKPFQTLETVDNTMAFWVHFTSAPATLTISGNLSYVTDVKLQPGWNFVGYPSILNDSVTVGQLLSDPTLNIDRVEGYDGSNSPYFLKELGPGYYLKPGEGYWMHVSGDRHVIWTVVGF